MSCRSFVLLALAVLAFAAIAVGDIALYYQSNSNLLADSEGVTYVMEEAAWDKTSFTSDQVSLYDVTWTNIGVVTSTNITPSMTNVSQIASPTFVDAYAEGLAREQMFTNLWIGAGETLPIQQGDVDIAISNLNAKAEEHLSTNNVADALRVNILGTKLTALWVKLGNAIYSDTLGE